MTERRSASAGFTLVEVMVSLMVLAVIMTLAYDGLDLVLTARDNTQTDQQQAEREQFAYSILLQDFFHLRARPVRDGLGDTEPAYLTPGGQYAVRLTRGGLPSVTGADGGLQRVAYTVSREHALLRLVWPVADRAAEVTPRYQILLEGIDRLELSQLDEQGQWQSSWPNSVNPDRVQSLPRAVLLHLVYMDGREYRLLVPGLDAPDLKVAS